MDLRQVDMREASDQLFGSHTMVQDVRHDRANGKPGAFNDRAPAADGRIAGDMRVQHFRHNLVNLLNEVSITEPARAVNVTERMCDRHEGMVKPQQIAIAAASGIGKGLNR